MFLKPVLYYIYQLLKVYAVALMVIPLTAVYQESKIWSHPALPSLNIFGMIKVYLLNFLWMGLTSVGCAILLPKYLLFGSVSVEHDSHCLMERVIAILITILVVGPVQIRNQEHNLPADGTPCIYVANHASQIDLAVVYFLFRKFKWIAKKSVLYLPGVGFLMFMSGHVFISRKKGKDKSVTVRRMYSEAKISLSKGVPMFLFPQGTRWMGSRLPFKDGAFNIAIDNEVPLIPISMDIPLSVWNDLYPLNIFWKKKNPVIITIHEAIPVKKGMDKEELKKKCYDVIYSVLPPVEKNE